MDKPLEGSPSETLVEKFALQDISYQENYADQSERMVRLIDQLGLTVETDPFIEIQKSIEANSEISDSMKGLFLMMAKEINSLKTEVSVLKGEQPVSAVAAIDYNQIFENNFEEIKELTSLYINACHGITGKLHFGYEAVGRQLYHRSNMRTKPDDTYDDSLNNIHNEVFKLVQSKTTSPENQLRALATFVALRERSMFAALDKTEQEVEEMNHFLNIISNPAMRNLAFEWNKRLSGAIQYTNAKKEEIKKKYGYNSPQKQVDLELVDKEIRELEKNRIRMRFTTWSLEESFNENQLVLTTLIDNLKRFPILNLEGPQDLDIDYVELSQFIFRLMTIPHEGLTNVKIVDTDLEARTKRLTGEEIQGAEDGNSNTAKLRIERES